MVPHLYLFSYCETQNNLWLNTCRHPTFRFQYFWSPTTGSDIGDIRKALQPAFKAKLSLQGHCPLTQIKLVQDGSELAAIFNNQRLVREIFPDNVFVAGFDLFAPMVENIPALFTQNRHYAIGVEGHHFCCAQFNQVPRGLLLRLNVDGLDVTSGDVIAYIVTFLPKVTSFYKRDKIIIRIGVGTKALAEDVEQVCARLHLPFYDEKNPSPIVRIIIADVPIRGVSSNI